MIDDNMAAMASIMEYYGRDAKELTVEIVAQQDGLIYQLQQIASDKNAERGEQISALAKKNDVLNGKAKLLGLITDKKEIKGNVTNLNINDPTAEELAAFNDAAKKADGDASLVLEALQWAQLLAEAVCPRDQRRRELRDLREDEEGCVHRFRRRWVESRRVSGVIPHGADLLHEGGPVGVHLLPELPVHVLLVHLELFPDRLEHALDVHVAEGRGGRTARPRDPGRQGIAEIERHALGRHADHHGRGAEPVRVVGPERLIDVRQGEGIQRRTRCEVRHEAIRVGGVPADVRQGPASLLGDVAEGRFRVVEVVAPRQVAAAEQVVPSEENGLLLFVRQASMLFLQLLRHRGEDGDLLQGAASRRPAPHPVLLSNDA
jgi:hypothetical protein